MARRRNRSISWVSLGEAARDPHGGTRLARQCPRRPAAKYGVYDDYVPVTLDTLRSWLMSPEHERLEFKAARQTFNPRDVHRYLVALANEGGGHLVLGVTNELPRTVVGTAALQDFALRAHELTRQLGLRVSFTELDDGGRRVLVATVGPRHRGVPVAFDGQYLMRVGESLVPMTADQLKAIFAEVVPDTSALPVPGVTFDDLDPAAIARFRSLWADHAEKRQGRERGVEIRGLSNAEVLERAGLARNDDVTLAALVLVGSEAALDRHVAHHEVVYEYRDRPGEVHARVRRNLRRAFMLSFDELWGLVDARNSIIEVPAGMLRKSIPAFNEAAVREGIMNAVTHRDYQRPESVFVRHDPDRLSIESPGGFPPNVTVENVLDRQVPRNRLIAESLERVGFVERSGQGADIMFREAVREAKPLPSFDGTDADRVVLTLFSTIRDPELVRAFDAITRDKLDVVHVRDFLVIDHVAQGKSVPASLADRVPKLIELGVLERQGRRRLILSQKLHSAAGRRGAYTRAVGLDRSAQLELARKHLQLAGRQGAPMREVMEVFPGLDRHQVFALLNALRRAGRARVEGERRTARWFADDA